MEIDEKEQGQFFDRHPNDFLNRLRSYTPERRCSGSIDIFYFYKEIEAGYLIGQKNSVFYNFSELVKLRENILKNLSES